MINPSADLDLVRAAIAGDADALDHLLEAYQPALTRFARGYCPTPEDVEDAVQETLWIATQKIGTLRVASAIVGWLFQIVKNVCYRVVYADHANFDLFEEYCEALVIDRLSTRSPEQAVLLQQDLRAALARLPITCREVLILRDLEGLTAPETADRLGLTIETVKSRLHRARAQMRADLIDWHE